MVRKAQKSKKSQSIWRRIWAIICWPFKMIWAAICWLWHWIAGINLVALLNLALLISIIVLFSLLIMDLRHRANTNRDAAMCNTNTVTTVATTSETNSTFVRPRIRRIESLPVRQAAPLKIAKAKPVAKKTENKKPIVTKKTAVAKTAAPVKPVSVQTVAAKPAAVKPAETKQTTASVSTSKRIVHGDMIIDSLDAAKLVVPGTQIRGNLYVQDLTTYTLPCNVTIDGNLIIRDVNMMQFCDKVKVGGKVYVSPVSGVKKFPCKKKIGGIIL